jgi:predicted Zn-ribbon and HTH transcriptional regulator
VGWSDLIVGHVVLGSSGDELRRHLRTLAKSTWQYVNWLTHAKSAVRFDARIAVESTSHVLNAFGAAIIRSERGVPDRCPSCQSYQIDSVYDPDIESVHPYRSVCRSCGWSEHEKADAET